MQPIEGNALRGHLDALVLAVLERGQAHGFEIRRRLEDAGSGALRMKEGSLYPALYRLEAEGCLRARWEDGESKRRGPRRRIYRITRKGKRRLAQGREQFQQFVEVIGGILATC